MAKRGPIPVKIDWDQVIKLISYQCTQKEVAAFFDISLSTLEAACERDTGRKLKDFWEQKAMLGRVRVRKNLFRLAESNHSGAVAAAIWLDKKLNPDERPDIDRVPTRDVIAIQTGLKTFAEFCASAKYPMPFEPQENMRRFAFEETEVRLLLGARGYGKTDYVTVLGTAYDIYCHRQMSNLIISKSKTRNSAIIDEIHGALLANDVPIEKKNTTLIRVEGLHGKEHSVEALTIRSSFRGRHPKRIIMDDPVTEEDVSDATRRLAKTKYDEAFKLCSNMVIIGQPAHHADLYATLRKSINTLAVPHGTIPQLDADLEAMAKAGVSPTSIEMSYHLEVPEDGRSIFAKLNRMHGFPTGDTVAYIDPADGGDTTALAIFHGYMDGIAVVGFCFEAAWYHNIDAIVERLKQYGVRRLCFETNKHGLQPIEQLQELLAPHGIGVVGRRSKSNKHGAIQSAGLYSHLIHLSDESDSVFTDQVVNYERKAKFDDAPDAIARGLEWLGLIKEVS